MPKTSTLDFRLVTFDYELLFVPNDPIRLGNRQFVFLGDFYARGPFFIGLDYFAVTRLVLFLYRRDAEFVP
jgi:hypothetical protein